MWGIVGTLLLGMGLTWMIMGFHLLAIPICVLSLALGYLKSRLILDKSAKRIIQRIREKGDDRCLGGALSWGWWLSVVFMMLLGWGLRHSGINHAYLGFIYAAVGSALLMGARVFILEKSKKVELI